MCVPMVLAVAQIYVPVALGDYVGFHWSFSRHSARSHCNFSPEREEKDTDLHVQYLW